MFFRRRCGYSALSYCNLWSRGNKLSHYSAFEDTLSSEFSLIVMRNEHCSASMTKTCRSPALIGVGCQSLSITEGAVTPNTKRMELLIPSRQLCSSGFNGDTNIHVWGISGFVRSLIYGMKRLRYPGVFENSFASTSKDGRESKEDFPQLSEGRTQELPNLDNRGEKRSRYALHKILEKLGRGREPNEALALLDQMWIHGPTPNEYTYGYVLGALKQSVKRAGHNSNDYEGQRICIKAIKLLEECMSKNIKPNDTVFNEAMDIQAVCGDLDRALYVFELRRNSGLPVSHRPFSILLKACAKIKDIDKAEQIFDWSIISLRHGQNLSAEEAEQKSVRSRFVEEMHHAEICKTYNVLWNGLLAVYASIPDLDGSFDVWNRMLSAGAVPDVHTERILARAFGSHPQLAAEIVAEAREQRKSQNLHSDSSRRDEIKSDVNEADIEAPSNQKTIVMDDVISTRKWSRPWDLRLFMMETKDLQGDMSEVFGTDDTIHSRNGDEYSAISNYNKRSKVSNFESHELSSLFTIDFHGHSQEAARMALLQRLDILTKMWPIVFQNRPTIENSDKGMKSYKIGKKNVARNCTESKIDGESSSGKAEHGVHSIPDPDSLLNRKHNHDFIIIVGQGHNTRIGNPVLKETVKDTLSKVGIKVEDVEDNPGRLRVDFLELKHFVTLQREAFQKRNFVQVISWRYGLTSVCIGAFGAAFLLISKLEPWL